ncbi:MAG: hypothetical protein LBE25_11590 [Arthrobacter sp.]|jgi:hypothetical protein|nr:hypothetical protein [Arthrobacter sp.]
MSTAEGIGAEQSQRTEHTHAPHLEAFDAHGVRMTLTVPAAPDEAATAAEVIRRLALETAPRWERVPGTVGGTALRARLLDEAGLALDGLGFMHWALSADGDVLASGSPRPQRAPEDGADPFFGEAWRATIANDDGLPLADVALAGTPGWHASLAVRRRGDAERARLVAVLADSARLADRLAGQLVAARPGEIERLEAALVDDGAAALVIAAGQEPLVTEGWPLGGQAWLASEARAGR